MLCVYIEVVRVANDHLNCLEVEVGVTLVGAPAPSAHYTHIVVTCLIDCKRVLMMSISKNITVNKI
jgi:hypothetical protein